MSGIKVASRYALSLLGLALEKNLLEQVNADIKTIITLCEQNKDFVNMLESPLIKTDKKLSVLKSIFGGKIHPITESFLTLMTKKRRETYLLEISRSFIEQYKNHKKIITALIISASGLDDSLRSKVLSIVKHSADSEVELIEKTDQKLLGGFILRLGDKQVDASITRKLRNLSMNFAENPYTKDF